MAREHHVRWGLTIPLPGVPLDQHQSLLRELADVGYTDVWTAEAGQIDGVTPLAAAAAWEPRLRLGAGVVSAFTRGPAVLASTAATMAQLAPGRFSIGVGSSSDVIVSRHNGLGFDRPYSRTRDVVRFLKMAFAGERISERFNTFEISGYRLGQPLERPPKVILAALRERMLRLAGAEADGAMLNWVSPEDVKAMTAIVREHNSDAEIVDRIMVCITEDRELVNRLVRPIAATYTAVGVYRAFHEWRGRGDQLAESWAAFDAGDRDAAAAAIPEDVIDAVCVHGTTDQCRARLEEYIASGVTVPVLAILSPTGDVVADALSLGPGPPATRTVQTARHRLPDRRQGGPRPT